MHNIVLHTRAGTRHPLTVTAAALRTLKEQLGYALYNKQGQLEPHPQAELVVHNEQGLELFREKAANLLPVITYD